MYAIRSILYQKIRRPYLRIFAFILPLAMGSISLGQSHSLSHSLGDDTKILSASLKLTADEYGAIKNGIDQRLKVYRDFFLAVVTHRQTPDGLAKIISEKQIQAVFASEGWNLNLLRETWANKTMDSLNLLYGPDLIKTQGGKWLALEDNFGTAMGGIADAQIIHNLYLDQRATADLSVSHGFENLVSHFLRNYGVNPKLNRVIALVVADEISPDYKSLESERLRSLLLQQGIEVIDPNLLSDADVKTFSNRPPSAILNFYDPQSATIRSQFYGEFFKKRNIPFLVSPGTEVLSNKAFLPFIDSIAQYLGVEKLEIKSPKSILLGDELPKPLAKWTIKEGYGQSGDQVYIPKFMSQKSIVDLRNYFMSMRRQKTFIAQTTIKPEIVRFNGEEMNYDIRPITSLVRGKSTSTLDVPWARAKSAAGDVKSNISKGGLNLVVEIAADCASTFRAK